MTLKIISTLSYDDKIELLRQKLNLSNEKYGVARILTLKKRQARKMFDEYIQYKDDFWCLEMWGLCHCRGVFSEVTFDAKELELHCLYPDGYYAVRGTKEQQIEEIKNHVGEDQIDYFLKHAGLLRLEL